MAENKRAKTVLILSNHFVTLFFFRRELIERLIGLGYRVCISMPEDERNSFFEELGCQVIVTPMSRRGINPAEDLRLIMEYRRIMRELKPDVIFSYTIKPNIYGAMASNALQLRQVCNVTGTGATFLKESPLSAVARVLYRASLRRAYRVFFQNRGDRDYFVSHRMVRDNWELLPGSGVNLQRHALRELPQGDTVSFIYVGRIMAVKGVDEFLECARQIRQRHPDTRFYMAGFVEEPRLEKLIGEYGREGVVEYLGFQEDIDHWIGACHCTILPSLGGEGVPNVLLESAAIGRACIASRISGSEDVVDDGHTGYLFTPGNAADLIDKVERFLSLTAEERRAMGLAGRAKVEREYDRETVIARYLREAEEA